MIGPMLQRGISRSKHYPKAEILQYIRFISNSTRLTKLHHAVIDQDQALHRTHKPLVAQSNP